MNGFPEILSIIGTVVLMFAVFAAAYCASKLMGKHYQPHFGGSKHIAVIDRAIVGKDSALLLVRAGEKVFLIGSTPGRLTLLNEMHIGQFTNDSPQKEPVPMDFISSLRNVIKGKTD